MLRSFKRFSSVVAKVRVKDLDKLQTAENVVINGWIKSVRKHKNTTFLELNDGSCTSNLQIVLDSCFCEEKYFYGSFLEIEGKLIRRSQRKPAVEVLCESILQHNSCDPSIYPFKDEWNHPFEFIRRFPHLRHRQKESAAVLRIRNQIEMAIHEYLQNKGFVHVHTPLITSSDCEGAGELFSVTSQNKTTNQDNEEDHFFGVPTFLTVSGQLHLEACAMGIGNVYTLSPAFRAEKSRPRTHLSEFHMLEVEMTFTKSLEEILDFLENSLNHTILKTLDVSKNDLEIFHASPSGLKHREIVERCIAKPFSRMNYKEVVDLLNSKLNYLKSGKVEWGDGLNAEHEKFITEYHNDCPVFVTNFPAHIKPFYALHNGDEEGTSASFDLLFPCCGELAGGTLREHSYDLLMKRLADMEQQNRYEWYADLRQFGGAPHGGYGLGFDRLIRFLLGVNTIRDVVPFPRASKVCLF